MTEALLFAAGFTVGAVMIALWLLSRRAGLQTQLGNAQTRAALLDQQAGQLVAEVNAVRAELKNVQEAREAAERQAAVTAKELQHKQQQFEQQKQTLADAEKKLTETFALVGGQALDNNSKRFLELAQQTFEKLMKEAAGDVEKKQQAIDGLIKPIKELLEKQNTALTDIEKTRAQDKSGLEKHLELIAQAHEKLGLETGKLVNALRRPEVRGRWGEQQLRNVVELAGMTAHCDFLEQQNIPAAQGEDGRHRPDLIVNLPGEGVIVVDSKVSLDAYFSALESDDATIRGECLKRHARQLSDHVAGLADKRYWDAVSRLGKRTPKLVIMFVSPESALVTALETDPQLHADAMSRHVLIATPTLLVAVLRAVAYGWQQEDVAANARQIAAVGRDLYERLGKFVEGYEAVGKRLGSAVTAYNSSIGTLEGRVLPSARKLKELHATTEGEIEAPPPLEIETRAVLAAELKPLPAALEIALAAAELEAP